MVYTAWQDHVYNAERLAGRVPRRLRRRSAGVRSGDRRVQRTITGGSPSACAPGPARGAAAIPEASVVAVGAQAARLTAEHPARRRLRSRQPVRAARRGRRPGPDARCATARRSRCCTTLRRSANVPGKRRLTFDDRSARRATTVVRRMYTDIDTSDGACRLRPAGARRRRVRGDRPRGAGRGDRHAGSGRRCRVPLFDAAPLTQFAVQWLEAAIRLSSTSSMPSFCRHGRLEANCKICTPEERPAPPRTSAAPRPRAGAPPGRRGAHRRADRPAGWSSGAWPASADDGYDQRARARPARDAPTPRAWPTSWPSPRPACAQLRADPPGPLRRGRAGRRPRGGDVAVPADRLPAAAGGRRAVGVDRRRPRAVGDRRAAGPRRRAAPARAAPHDPARGGRDVHRLPRVRRPRRLAGRRAGRRAVVDARAALRSRVRASGRCAACRARTRYDFLVTLGALGVVDVAPSSLLLGSEAADPTVVAAKRVFGIGDAINLQRRASDLAAAIGVEIAALDLALVNWARPPGRPHPRRRDGRARIPLIATRSSMPSERRRRRPTTSLNDKHRRDGPGAGRGARARARARRAAADARGDRGGGARRRVRGRVLRMADPADVRPRPRMVVGPRPRPRPAPGDGLLPRADPAPAGAVRDAVPRPARARPASARRSRSRWPPTCSSSPARSRSLARASRGSWRGPRRCSSSAASTTRRWRSAPTSTSRTWR